VVTTIWQDPPEDETISGLMIPSGTGMRIRIPWWRSVDSRQHGRSCWAKGWQKGSDGGNRDPLHIGIMECHDVWEWDGEPGLVWYCPEHGWSAEKWSGVGAVPVRRSRSMRICNGIWDDRPFPEDHPDLFGGILPPWSGNGWRNGPHLFSCRGRAGFEPWICSMHLPGISPEHGSHCMGWL